MLSTQKFSSNVIEKFLAMDDANSFELIVKEISASNIILQLLQDSYANYVIQKALAVQHPIVQHLVEEIRPHLPAIKNTPYGKKLTSKIQKKFPPRSAPSSDASTQQPSHPLGELTELSNSPTPAEAHSPSASPP